MKPWFIFLTMIQFAYLTVLILLDLWGFEFDIKSLVKTIWIAWGFSGVVFILAVCYDAITKGKKK